jgi:hypothetical protein
MTVTRLQPGALDINQEYAIVARGENFAEKAGFSVEVSVRPSHPFLKNLLNFLTLSLSVCLVCLSVLCCTLYQVLFNGVPAQESQLNSDSKFRFLITSPDHGGIFKAVAMFRGPNEEANNISFNVPVKHPPEEGGDLR